MVVCDVGLDAGNDLHIRGQIMLKYLLAGRLQAGLVVLVAKFDLYVAGGV